VELDGLKSLTIINIKNTILMAGILFTDRERVLVGFNEKKKFISGIGGKMLEDEPAWQCALREMVEELFEIKCSLILNETLLNVLKFDNVIGSKDYTLFIMSFQDLQKILDVVVFFKFESPVYKKLPENLGDLLLKRIHYSKAEISQLFLLPFQVNLRIDNNLELDIKRFKVFNLINE